ncbi:hypothetical protein HKX48_006106 [Thoreauomyces humboldtii]|nr:hypothetical protein HKX48_006106 [Thoreauomyces humboldtii]
MQEYRYINDDLDLDEVLSKSLPLDAPHFRFYDLTFDPRNQPTLHIIIMARSVQRLVLLLVAMPTLWLLYTTFLGAPSVSLPDSLPASVTKLRDTKASSSTVAKPCYHVEGFTQCPYFQAAKSLSESLPEIHVAVNQHDRSEWPARRSELQQTVKGAKTHRTSPFVWRASCEDALEGVQFVGGYSEFQEYVDSKKHL